MLTVAGAEAAFGRTSAGTICAVTKYVAAEPTQLPSWTFLTNHAHVLVCIAQNREVRLAEMARLVGIGERAVHRIVRDLVDAGYVSSTKVGRRNEYELSLDRPLRHPLEAHHRLAEIFGPLSR